MIVSQLNSVDINFEDEIKALILVSSLPEPCEGGEVRRKTKINMVDQNQRIEENPRTDQT